MYVPIQVMRLLSLVIGTCVGATRLSMLVKNARLSRGFSSVSLNQDVSVIRNMLASLAMSSDIEAKLVASVTVTHALLNTHRMFMRTMRTAAPTKWKESVEKCRSEMNDAVIEFLKVMDSSKVAGFSHQARISDVQWKKNFREISSRFECLTFKFASVLDDTVSFMNVLVSLVQDFNKVFTGELIEHVEGKENTVLAAFCNVIDNISDAHETYSLRASRSFDAAIITRSKYPKSDAAHERVVAKLTRFDSAVSIVTAESLRTNLLTSVAERLVAKLWNRLGRSGGPFPLPLQQAWRAHKLIRASRLAEADACGQAYDKLMSKRSDLKWFHAVPAVTVIPQLKLASRQYLTKATSHKQLSVEEIKHLSNLASLLI